jgi:aminopeptidase N
MSPLHNQPVVKHRKDYKPSPYLIQHSQLKFQLFDNYTLVEAKLIFCLNPLSQQPSLPALVLDGLELELLSIELNHKPLAISAYHQTDETLSVSLNNTDINADQTFSLKTQVKIQPQNNRSLEGLYTSGGKFCTQCEAEGFRKITFYLDRPDVMAEFKVRIEADRIKYPLLLSNGNCINRGELVDNRHFVEWHDPFVKPCYLFALVAGDLDCLEDEFITQSGRNIKLQLFVDKGKLNQCRFAMDSLIASMRWDEEKFGLEYDLDLYMIVAVSDFNMGAMENKGLNIFNTAFVLANQQTATDADFEGVERVIAHEYFHNWTGNRVTCRDWFQLSLKEGLTVFRDQKFSEDMQSYAVERIDQVKIIRSHQFAEDSGPMAHPIRPDSYIEMNNFYTVTVYNKGAEVIRMMHTLLGEQGFRAGMDLYFERHDGQAVTCEDFVCAMEDANQVDWSQFRNWYRFAGTPRVEAKLSRVKASEFKLSFKQTSVQNNQVFMLPIKTGFIAADGTPVSFNYKSIVNTDASADDIANHNSSPLPQTEQAVLVVTDVEQSFSIFCDEEKLIPSFLRDFSAPVQFSYDYTQTDLGLLFAHDSNAFNRWDAGQTLMQSILVKPTAVITKQDLNLIEQAFKRILNDANLDNSLKSLAVELPALSSLISGLTKVDLDQLFCKHQQLKQHVSQSLESTWLDIYNNLKADNSANRKLRNIALNYLMTADEKQYFSLAAKQQNQANNMTDEIAALQVIAKVKCQSLSQIQSVQAFYDKWHDEELVMDKWFSAQVLLNDEKIIEQLEALLCHHKFSIENPNKVRAVVGAFVTANLIQFHAATGRGYEFLANKVIQLNQINPQIAARLAKQFSQWRKFDPKRQALIQEQLERIRAVKQLSKDVFEVVDKSLNS